MTSSHLALRTFVVVDVARFSASDRDDHGRRAIRAALRDAVERAFVESRLNCRGELIKDSGDGLIMFLPERVALPDRILHPWTPNLGVELAHLNHLASEATRIQVRVAVHQGYLSVDRPDGDGTSADLILACRLAEAEQVKDALAAEPDATLALVVSDPVYQGVVRHRPRGVDPAAFRRVSVRVKETTADAWIHLPGHPPGHRPGRRSSPPVPDQAPGASPGRAVSTVFNAPVTVHRDFVQGDKVEHHHPYPSGAERSGRAAGAGRCPTEGNHGDR